MNHNGIAELYRKTLMTILSIRDMELIPKESYEWWDKRIYEFSRSFRDLEIRVIRTLILADLIMALEEFKRTGGLI